jgi:hypothetical protein
VSFAPCRVTGTSPAIEFLERRRVKQKRLHSRPFFRKSFLQFFSIYLFYSLPARFPDENSASIFAQTAIQSYDRCKDGLMVLKAQIVLITYLWSIIKNWVPNPS